MLKNYLLIALRNFRKNKVFSFINILGLTLGITCSLAIFMIVRYEWSFDTFHPGYKRIYRVVSQFHYPEGMEYQSGVPSPLPPAFRNDFPQLEGVATIFGGTDNQVTISDKQGTSAGRRFREEDGIFYADPAFFDLFRFKWLQGDPHDILSRPGTVALTRATAERYFGDWQQAIGKTILKDNAELLTVQGILENPPANTDFPIKAVISYATIAAAEAREGWGTVTSRLQCFVRLPESLPLDRFNALLPAFRKKYRNNNTDFFALQPLTDIHFNAQYGNFRKHTVSKETLWVLSLIGVFLLVLGCINFINLATAQAVRRSREVGIRKVLGSHRWQLILQFLGETALLVGVASLLAIGLLFLLSPMAAGITDVSLSLALIGSPSTLLFLFGMTITVTFLAGLYPALILSGFRPIAALKNKIGAGSGGQRGGLSLRHILVVTQFTIAQVLIVCVLVAISQMNFFRNAPLGFNKDAVITVPLPADSTSRSKWETFRQQALQQPGVDQVSLSYTPPASGGTHLTDFRFAQNIKDENFEVELKSADAAYLSTYDLHLVAGRFYPPSDTIREAVVNETFLRKEGITDPHAALGKIIYIEDTRAPIVGVVRDFHEHSLRDPIGPVIITTSRRFYKIAGIKLSTTGIPSTLQHLEKLFNSYFPDYIFEHRFLDETVARFYDEEEKLSKTFQFFAAIALLISCLGLYGLILFTTSQRMKEVGVRKVLGASVASISFLFIREFCWLIGIAFVIAAPIAWYSMNKWLQNFTFRIHMSAWMFVATGLTALLIGLVTIGYRTIRTALANPVRSLRSE